MKYYALTHKGIVRSENEDRLFIPEGDSGCFIAVADGMGGHNAGEVASELVIETLTDFFRHNPGSQISEPMLRDVLISANRRVWDDSQNNPLHFGMGSTATVAAFNNNEAIIGHVGDSRAYIYRDGMLKQITKDHSYVQMLIDHGYISKSDAMHHPHKNVITRAIGIDELVDVDTYAVPLIKGDVMLLCSDGLNTVVNDDDISSILGGNIDAAAESLVNAALTSGGPDNVSVAIAYMDGDQV